MNMDQQTVKSRPRVSRACERCRVKKAKCDGEKPCRRCDLDKAPCSYKIRRKTESSSTNQRYTNLLLQHQEALTAGVVELYKRLVRGQRWDGAPIEEVNGSPSVHSILERVGVLDHDEDANHYNLDSCSTKNRLEPVSPVGPIKAFAPTIAPKPKRPVRAAMGRESTSHAPVPGLPEQRSCFGQSPKSATATTMSRTSTACGQAASALDTDEVPVQSTYFPQPPSPLTPMSNSRSSSLAHCSRVQLKTTSTTTTSWVDSPVDEFYDELFGTPIPTPRTEVQSRQAQLQSDHQIEPLPQPQPQGQTPYTMPPSFASPNLSAAEAYNAGYFFDATLGGGMPMYGWDSGPGGSGGIEYNAWDTGVYV
ncbi:uncharacterized protein Z519_11604 [Cladophialophora bantiana CBS 173.52]|uniref:Zn(2)-C6 fungal-type domain-containing protein n=1 Tax=Cladophialophora bantiana (strain ATCC 10958 / CBS 173.52 / CDC B-1940 / NIH 8579) TaxID=1442370 RepID=A0A0D2H9S5_CLAB1|nr:uncharacterized protein Z519_11604 [Cladophialophora bantiana CBS 173.52]KIW87630.1 hypothetical protein Z519_11604 [Cladophialophora bantiana CBS 173.52]